MLIWAIVLVIIAVACFIGRNRVPDGDAHAVLTVAGWIAALLALIVVIYALVGSAEDGGGFEADLVAPLALGLRRWR